MSEMVEYRNCRENDLQEKELEMKKTLAFAFIILLVAGMFASCDPGLDNPGNNKPTPTPPNNNDTEYNIGETGPGGGLIFYDCDADNESGNADGLISTECGWRYLEAAPADITVPSRTGYALTHNWGNDKFAFGFYRTYMTNLSAGTSTGLGTGKANTQALVAHADCTYQLDDYTEEETPDYFAAKLCSDYISGGKDDWFLPSRQELYLMLTNLYANPTAGFCTDSGEGDDRYWSSSEDSVSPGSNAYSNRVSNIAGSATSYRSSGLHVRAIRSF